MYISQPRPAALPLPARSQLHQAGQVRVHGQEDDQLAGDPGRHRGGPQGHRGDEGVHQGER